MAVGIDNVDGTHVGTNLTGGTFSFTSSGTRPYIKIGICGFDSGSADWGPTKAPAGYVRYNGVDLTRETRAQDGVGDAAEWWGMIPASVGAYTVDVLMGNSGNIDELAISVESYTGVHETTPTAGAANNFGTSSPCTVTAGAVPSTGDLISDVAYVFGTPSFSVGADQDSRINQNITSSSSVLTSTQPDTAADQVMSWTGTMSNWVTTAVVIKASAADPSAGRLFIRKTHRPAAFAPGRSR